MRALPGWRAPRTGLSALAGLLVLLLAAQLRAADPCADVEDGRTCVPLHRLTTGHDLVEASIDGRALWLLVDTGTQGLVLNESELEAFGVDASVVLETIEGAGIGGPLIATRHPVAAVSIRNGPAAPGTVLATDLGPVLAGISRLADRPVRGILGQEVLRARGAVLELGAGRLLLDGAEAPPPSPSAGRSVPLQWLDNDLLVLEAQLEGRPLTLLLDSGARVSIIDRDRLAALGLAPSSRGRRQSLGGAGGGGRSSASTSPIEALQVAGARVDLDEITVIDLSAVRRSVLELGGRAVDGVLGLDVLLAHDAVIDLQRASLQLAEAPGPKVEPRFPR